MTKRPAELRHARLAFAGMLHGLLEAGQRANEPEAKWKPWSNLGFADLIGASEAAVRTWRDLENPIRPTHVVRMISVLFGNNPKHAAAKQAFHDAWRRAGGYLPVEPEPPPPRTIEPAMFSEVAEIVDLEVSQPTPDNSGNLILPVTLRIHPDPNCEHDGDSIEIGVTAPYVMIDSAHWRPNPDSVFRGKQNPNVRGVGRAGTIRIAGPTDALGRIDGAPLEDEPRVTLEPMHEGADGPVTVSVRVPRNGFMVTAKDTMTDAQTAVLDAIFANEAFPRDAKKRLIVAQETVRPGTKRTGE